MMRTYIAAVQGSSKIRHKWCAFAGMLLCVLGLAGFATPAAAMFAAVTPAAHPPASAGAAEAFTELHRKVQSEDQGIVVILTDSMAWADINPHTTPHLAAWAAAGTLFNIAPPNIAGWDCPQDVALAIGAGKVVSEETVATSAQCGLTTMRGGTVLPSWRTVADAAAVSQAPVGALGAAFEAAHIEPVLIGREAGVLALTPDGIVPSGWSTAGSTNAKLADQLRAAMGHSDLTIVDASATDFGKDVARANAIRNQGILMPASMNSEPESPEESSLIILRSYREQQGQRNAQRADALLEVIPEGTAVIFVNLQGLGASPALQPGFISYGTQTEGPTDIVPTEGDSELGQGGIGWSPQVRQDGTVSYTAIAPTLLHLLDVQDSDDVFGGEISAVNAANGDWDERISALDSAAHKALAIRSSRTPFYRVMSWATLGVVGVGTLWFALMYCARLRSVRDRMAFLTHKPRCVRAVRVGLIATGLTVCAVPLSSHIVTVVWRWWYAGSPTLALLLATWGLAASIALISSALLRVNPWAPVTAIASVTAVVLLADVATGSRIMADSPMGFNTLMGARFYGIGNEAYALVSVGMFFAIAGVCAALLRRQVPRWSVVGIAAAMGVCTIVIDLWPTLGADFGGALGLVPALIVFLALLARVRVSPKMAVIAVLATVGVAGAAALADWLRPANSRTHLGNFVQSIIDGEALTIIWRKLSVNIHLLGTSMHRWIVLLGLIFVVVVLIPYLRRYYRSVRSSVLIMALVSMAVCLLLGFALNDSGIAIPGMGFILSLPGAVAAVSYHKKSEAGTLPTSHLECGDGGI